MANITKILRLVFWGRKQRAFLAMFGVFVLLCLVVGLLWFLLRDKIQQNPKYRIEDAVVADFSNPRSPVAPEYVDRKLVDKTLGKDFNGRLNRLDPKLKQKLTIRLLAAPWVDAVRSCAIENDGRARIDVEFARPLAIVDDSAQALDLVYKTLGSVAERRFKDMFHKIVAPSAERDAESKEKKMVVDFNGHFPFRDKGEEGEALDRFEYDPTLFVELGYPILYGFNVPPAAENDASKLNPDEFRNAKNLEILLDEAALSRDDLALWSVTDNRAQGFGESLELLQFLARRGGAIDGRRVEAVFAFELIGTANYDKRKKFYALQLRGTAEQENALVVWGYADWKSVKNGLEIPREDYLALKLEKATEKLRAKNYLPTESEPVESALEPKIVDASQDDEILAAYLAKD